MPTLPPAVTVSVMLLLLIVISSVPLSALGPAPSPCVRAKMAGSWPALGYGIADDPRHAGGRVLGVDEDRRATGSQASPLYVCIVVYSALDAWGVDSENIDTRPATADDFGVAIDVEVQVR